jgi:hypothetical protein
MALPPRSPVPLLDLKNCRFSNAVGSEIDLEPACLDEPACDRSPAISHAPAGFAHVGLGPIVGTSIMGVCLQEFDDD